MEQFRGTGVAVVSPFDKNFEIDYNSLEKILENLIEGKIEYIVSLGTTGESPTLDATEKKAILDFTVKIVNKRVPVVAGFGGNNTKAVIDAINDYSFDGIDAILSVSPYYNKPSQEAIYQHYMAIDKISPRPIIIYNVPPRTSSNLTAETTLRLANDGKNFFAVKEASGDLSQCMNLVANKPEDFLILSGDDVLTLPMLSFGMDGLISVVGNVLPLETSEMVRAGLNGNFEKAKNLHFKLLDMINLIFKEGNPAGIKEAMAIKNLCENHVRLPLIGATNDLSKLLSSALKLI